MLKDQIELYDEKKIITSNVKSKIKQLNIVKVPLRISISGKIDTPLSISVKTPDTSFVVISERKLVKSSIGNRFGTDREEGRDKNSNGSENLAPKKSKEMAVKFLDYHIFIRKLKSLNSTAYFIERLELKDLQSDVFLPFKELTLMKKEILATLNGLKEIVEPVDVPFLKKQRHSKIEPDLSVLVASEADLSFCQSTSAHVFFEIPNCFGNQYSELISIFSKNKKLLPWFPTVLIGEDYQLAVELLKILKPERIVTNNTGIAYEACQNGISWIAGPYLNIVNSFSLLCLKEKFNCQGAFISNEISKNQIKNIISPAHFKLYYRIYHPILLLSSRQCLFHSVIGCEKNRIDRDCIETCKKSASITNLKEIPLFIEKTRGNYHGIYHNINLLNTDIVRDFPEMFSSFFIDLRDIKTETRIALDKSGIITLFESLLRGDPHSERKLNQVIHPSTNTQYETGV